MENNVELVTVACALARASSARHLFVDAEGLIVEAALANARATVTTHTLKIILVEAVTVEAIGAR